jgi:GTP-binding protein EngB required for normal cell division
VGRTGVGKSSTINSLIGKEVSRVGHFQATTKAMKGHETEIQGIPFVVIDTPGLTENKSTDLDYLADIHKEITQIDCLWFVTSLLREARFEESERETIRLISETFGAEVWKWSILVFTFADRVRSDQYEERLSRWTDLLRKEIAGHTDSNIAKNIPAIAVANGENEPLPTPDGKAWLDELYTQVFLRISSIAAIPFYLAAGSKTSSKMMAISATEKPVVQHSQDLSIAFEKIRSSTPSAINELTKNYEQARQQAKGWYHLSLVAATAGFILVGAGIITVVFGQVRVGVITSLSGIIPNAAATLFFRQSKKADERVDATNSSLAETYKIQVAIDITNSISDCESRDKLKAQITESILL